MGVYIPNVNEKKFYEICKEHNLEFVAIPAADAIEERCQQVDKFAEEAARLYAKQPKWIPVTERLPEEWWPVLGLIKFHEKEEPPAQQVLWYLGNGHWRETWRGDMIESDVSHWMPLPQPPEEET